VAATLTNVISTSGLILASHTRFADRLLWPIRSILISSKIKTPRGRGKQDPTVLLMRLQINMRTLRAKSGEHIVMDAEEHARAQRSIIYHPEYYPPSDWSSDVNDRPVGSLHQGSTSLASAHCQELPCTEFWIGFPADDGTSFIKYHICAIVFQSKTFLASQRP
jgi:hypothetical protein